MITTIIFMSYEKKSYPEIGVVDAYLYNSNYGIPVQDIFSTVERGIYSLQSDKLCTTKCFWYLVKRDLAKVRNCTLASLLNGIRTARP